MNKLTAEVARMDIGHLKSFQANPHVGLSLKEEKYLQALEIALPVLEQKTHESVIAEQLEAVMNSMTLDLHQTVIIGCAIDHLNELSARLQDLSSPVLEQQSGWISCNELMPEPCKQVLALYTGGGMNVLFTNRCAEYWDDGDFHSSIPLSDISHWMPLPAPPMPQPSTTPHIDNDGSEG